MRTPSKKEVIKAPMCTICLERPSNCSLDGCAHLFCLRCIKRWSRTKNNCPLCRERFLKLQCKNRVIEVLPIPERSRPVRPPAQTPPTPPRTIIYMPILVYPHNQCFFYPLQPSIFFSSPMANFGSTYPMGTPTFFTSPA